jgi:hypothetical protein
MGRFDYPRMVHDALRQVVRLALEEVRADGLAGDHHLYITFHTHHPGVEMPAFLRDVYPETITIVLQNQFWNLEPGAEAFSVTLAFSGARHRLTVPYAAIESFADPGAEFGLRFEPPRQPAGAEAKPEAVEAAPVEHDGGEAAPAPAEAPEPAERSPGRPADVVRLDEFRKR